MFHRYRGSQNVAPTTTSTICSGFGLGFFQVSCKLTCLRLTETTVVLDHPREIPSKQRQYLSSHHHIRHSHRLQHGNRVRDQSDHLRKISPYIRIMLTAIDLKTPCPQLYIIFSYLKTEVARKNTRHILQSKAEISIFSVIPLIFLRKLVCTSIG